MNGPTSVIFKASPGDWRATPMRHEQHSEPPPRRTRPAAGFPRSGSSSRPSSWAAGNLPVAEELARSEAIRLLSDDRKDRLAEVYHAFARRLLEPDDPVIQPDPHAAWGLLSEARDLAKSPVLRARLLFAMGRTSQMAGYFPRAIEYFQAYLKEYPGGADRLAARFHLGESQRQFGQSLSARLTWADLVRDIERRQPFRTPRSSRGSRSSTRPSPPGRDTWPPFPTVPRLRCPTTFSTPSFWSPPTI